MDGWREGGSKSESESERERQTQKGRERERKGRVMDREGGRAQRHRPRYWHRSSNVKHKNTDDAQTST